MTFAEEMNARDKLREIRDLLAEWNACSNDIEVALAGDDAELWRFLTSNELWGGAGSVADQRLLDHPEQRKRLENLLIDLGEIQMAIGKVSVRTEMWTSAFKQWHKRK